MNHHTRTSYVIMAVLLVLIGCFHLGTLLLTALFGFFALRLFSFGRSRILGLGLYIVAVTILGWGLIHFSRQAYLTLPRIAETTIPAVTEFAQKQGFELPFTDYASLKDLAINEVKQDVASAGRHARAAAFQFVQLLIGLVVAASLFLSADWGSEADPATARDSLYATMVRELSLRFQTFFRSFSRVVGAQILISAINTALTAAFLIWSGFPYAPILIATTFLCGLLPIIGNIISNTMIVFVGFTLSPHMALIALIFLMVIHKLEYFLNSKIIGDRIKNPMWLTLIGLVLGEKLMGVPGMVLAPVVLHYIKVEASQNKVPRLHRMNPPTTKVPDTVVIEPKPRRAPTLYVIIVDKLIKGALALALAFGVLKLAGQDLSGLFDRLVTWVHLDPESRFFSDIDVRLDRVTPTNVRWVAVATFIYSLISFVEGIGLMFRAPWAGWLAIGESAFFIPIEVRELVRHPNWFVFGVLAFNVLIVWYLYANRGRLFRHHHHPGHGT